MSPDEKKKHDALRVLAVVCRMTGGQPGVKISRAALSAEIERLDLFNMSDEEFHAYHRETVALMKEGLA